MDFALRSKRVIDAPASIHVRDGRIAAVRPHDDVPAGLPVVDAGDAVILPGLVDTHVHINEPGRTNWEGFVTATRAAAAGGVTTIIEMPLNSIPPTTTAAAYQEKLAAAKGKCWVDVGFWGGVVPGNLGELAALWQAGVFGFKCFLTPSGVQEFGFVEEEDLRPAMTELARLGAPLLAHAEILPAEPDEDASWLSSRPPEAEHAAIALLVRLARETGARVHVVHLAAATALDMIRAAKADGVPLTVETCPHYLYFAADEIPGDDPLFKCAPPIRERGHRNGLRQGLAGGIIDLIASDHSPCPLEMKQGAMSRAWGGIASLELGLAVVATLHARAKDLARWLAAAPASLAGLARKGRIAEGCDADLVIWDPDWRWVCEPEKLHQRHKLTAYAGRALRGRVRATYLRGQKIYENGQFGPHANGELLKRGEA